MPDATDNNEHVVYVHGINRHTEGYSKRWFESLQPHLDRDITRKEVRWSDHVNPSGSLSMNEDEHENKLVESIRQELQMRAEKHANAVSQGDDEKASVTTLGDGFGLDDFARYMYIESTRNDILADFDSVVRPLLQAGDTIHVIAHSWGSVVAYEGLRRLDDVNFAGKVNNLFTVGSALAIEPVQSNLFQRVNDGKKPRHVERIINLDAAGDIVGDSIAKAFDVDEEFISLEPVGCKTLPILGIALDPTCAHRSYFVPQNTKVNRDLFARFINAAS